MNDVTDRQAEVLAYLQRYIKQNGYSPTLQQMADDFGWSSANASRSHLLALVAAGRVRKTPRGYVPL